MRVILDAGFPQLVEATFLERPNRFLLWAEVAGHREAVASCDPGRLEGILRPGARLLLVPATSTMRRTAYSLVLAHHGRGWVSLMPALANRIVQFALARKAIPALRGAKVVSREVAREGSRLDFLLHHRGAPLLLEVKSAAMVVKGRALFPDAPTVRGVRHLRALTAAARRAEKAALLFVVQRHDARSLAPFAERDPDFARALRDAARAGVRLLAYTCRVSPRGCTLDREIPVELGSE
jgi:sugar fermentation stimulation protein A